MGISLNILAESLLPHRFEFVVLFDAATSCWRQAGGRARTDGPTRNFTRSRGWKAVVQRDLFSRELELDGSNEIGRR